MAVYYNSLEKKEKRKKDRYRNWDVAWFLVFVSAKKGFFARITTPI